MMGVWGRLKRVFKKFPEFFPPDKITKEEFFFCYEAVIINNKDIKFYKIYIQLKKINR